MNDFYRFQSVVTQNDIDIMKRPRYSGIATFMRTPLAQSLDDLDIALIGVPYDGGLTNRPGARHGPREIRNMSSLMRTIHHVTRTNPYELCNVADVGDVFIDELFHLDQAIKEIHSFYEKVAAESVIPLTAGGDHSITYPIMKGLVSPDQPVGLIHIDAHTDTWDIFGGSKFHHGAPFRLAVEDGILDPKRTIQIGIRGAQTITQGWDYSNEKGMRVVFMEEFSELGTDQVIKLIHEVIGDQPAYLSFDIDSLDPVYAPGTGTPEIGGLTTIDAQALIRGCRGLNLIGADVVEVSPPFDQTGNTALTGATIMFEILCILSECIHNKSKLNK